MAAATDLEGAALRLQQSIAQLTGHQAKDDDRFGVAVSGGPDSLALLLVAHAAFGDRTFAATVDHQLRPESHDEARHVAAICEGRGITHTILTPAEPIRGTVQANARATRYALLGQWCEELALDWLMTAHHADDQLETLVMRANRSSGVAGMAGIRARQGRLLRPLLEWRRHDLAALVKAQAVVAVDDPSNRDDRFDRARIRPALQTCTLIDPVAANATARNLADADQALEWTADQLAAERLQRGDKAVVLNARDVPTELLRRLVQRALLIADPLSGSPRGQQLNAAIQALARGDQAMLGEVLIKPDRSDTSSWHFEPAPPRRGG